MQNVRRRQPNLLSSSPVFRRNGRRRRTHRCGSAHVGLPDVETDLLQANLIYPRTIEYLEVANGRGRVGWISLPNKLSMSDADELDEHRVRRTEMSVDSIFEVFDSVYCFA